MGDDRNQQGGDAGSEGMSKEEWLRQNPGKAVDPEGEEVDEGMSKADYLRKTGGDGGSGGGQ